MLQCRRFPTDASIVMLKRSLLAFIVVAACSSIVFGESPSNELLKLSRGDLVMEESTAGGYHLWVKKKAGIGSVLLTESTQDPLKKLDIFAFRDPNYNPINGDEKRMLNGEFLGKNIGIVDSTVESHAVLGQAFHLFVPYVVEYGYPWSREGETQITVGSFLNVRTFAKPYADWSGAARDNPFIVTLAPEKEQAVQPEGDYNPDTVNEFKKIASDSGGKAIMSPGKDDLIPTIRALIDESEGDSLDLVLALDTTLSMKDEFPFLRRELVPFVRSHTKRFENLRVGLLLYRDYFEEYLVKVFPFADDLKVIQSNIDSARVHGGKEIPEAVYEALYSAVDSYDWAADARLAVLIGDAPPHPRPRGAVTKEMVYSKARNAGVTIHTIILPQ